MIENKIQELIEALNANTAALLSGAASKPAKKEKPAKSEEPAVVTHTAEDSKAAAEVVKAQVVEAPKPVEITVTDIRAVCQLILDAGQKEKLREINTKHGIERATAAVGTDKAAVVMADLIALAESLKK
jgi:hypothetical protein